MNLLNCYILIWCEQNSCFVESGCFEVDLTQIILISQKLIIECFEASLPRTSRYLVRSSLSQFPSLFVLVLKVL